MRKSKLLSHSAIALILMLSACIEPEQTSPGHSSDRKLSGTRNPSRVATHSAARIPSSQSNLIAGTYTCAHFHGNETINFALNPAVISTALKNANALFEEYLWRKGSNAEYLWFTKWTFHLNDYANYTYPIQLPFYRVGSHRLEVDGLNVPDGTESFIISPAQEANLITSP